MNNATNLLGLLLGDLTEKLGQLIETESNLNGQMMVIPLPGFPGLIVGKIYVSHW